MEEDDSEGEGEVEEAGDSSRDVVQTGLKPWVSLIMECAADDCECTEEDRETYRMARSQFKDCMSSPERSTDLATLLAHPVTEIPTCPCLCMVSGFTQHARLPLILSNMVRFRLRRVWNAT